MEEILLDSKLREKSSKGILRKQRKNGFIPAIVYGHNEPNVSIWIDEKSFTKILHTKSGPNILIKLNLGNGDVKTVIIKEIQRNVLTHKPIHIDFLVVSMKEKIEVNVPIKVVGEAPGVKISGGILEHILRELTIRCLPNEIPEFIEVDVSKLNIGDSILVKDLPELKNIEILSDKNSIIVNVVSPTRIEETPVSVMEQLTPTEPEVISKGKKEIPEEVTEGGAKPEKETTDKEKKEPTKPANEPPK